MTIIGDSYIEVHADTDKFQRDAESRIGGIAKKMAGLFAAGFAADKAFGFLKDAVGAASDLGETTSKVSVVFGSASKQVLDFAANSAKSMGQSRNEALAAAGTFGNLLRSVGLSEDAAAKFSTQMVKLGGDLASFNNTDPAEAIDALRAGLVGETEPLKRFGVNLNEATLQAKAMSLGIVHATGNVTKITAAQLAAGKAQTALTKAQAEHGEGSKQAADAAKALEVANGKLAEATKGTVPQLNAAQKAQSAYALVMEQTKLAQGDFERTSGGLANQQRILAAQFEDVKAKVGSALLPAITTAITFVNEQMIPAFTKVGEVVGPVFDGIASKVGGFVGALTGQGGGGGPGGGIANAVTFVRAQFDTLVKAVSSRMDAIREAIQHVINVVVGAWRIWGDQLKEVARIAFDQIKNVVQTAVRIVRDVIDTVLALINGDWAKAWKAISDIPKAALGYAIETIRNVGRLLGQAVEAILSLVRLAWDKAWAEISSSLGRIWKSITDAAKAGAAGLLTWFTELPGKTLTALGDIAGFYFDVGKSIVDGVVKGVKSAGGKVLDVIKDVVYDKPLGLVKKLWSIFSPSKVMFSVGGFVIQGFVDGLKDKSKTMKQAVEEVFGAVVGQVGDILGGFGAAAGLTGAKRGVTNAAKTVTDLLAEQAKLPAQIAAQQALVAKLHAAAVAVTPEEALRFSEAEGALADARQAAADAAAALNTAQSRKGPTTQQQLDFLEAQQKAADAAKALRTATADNATTQADASATAEDKADAQRLVAIRTAEAKLATEQLTVAEKEAVAVNADLVRLARDKYQADLRVQISTEALGLLYKEIRSDTDDVAEAQDKLNDLLKRNGEIAGEVRDAQEALNQAKLSAVAAELAYVQAQQQLLSVGPQAVELFKKLAKEAGLNREEIDKLVASYGRLAGGAKNVTVPNLTGGVVQPGPGSISGGAYTGPGIFGPGGQPGIGSGQLTTTPGVTIPVGPDGLPTGIYYQGRPLQSYTNERGQLIYFDPNAPDARPGGGGGMPTAGNGYDDWFNQPSAYQGGMVYMAAGAVQVGVMDTDLLMTQLNVEAALGNALSDAYRMAPVL